MSPWRPYLYLRLFRHLSAKVAFLQVSTIQALGRRALSSSLLCYLDDLTYTIHTYLKYLWQGLNYLIRYHGLFLYHLYLNHYRDYGHYCVLN